MFSVVIVGGGFAGLWAALSAANATNKQGIAARITVVSMDSHLTIRPRLYETTSENLRVELERTFNPVGVELIQGTVFAINANNGVVQYREESGKTQDIRYDKLILTVGSQLRSLPIDGLSEHSWNIDSYNAAVALDKHIKNSVKKPLHVGSNTFVILGAGFTGVELATEMRTRIAACAGSEVAEEARIILVDHSDLIAPDLGDNPRPVIEDALKEARVEIKLGVSVEAVKPNSVKLSNGEKIDTYTVIVTAGMEANRLGGILNVERDELGRLYTDDYLRVNNLENIFAAGDIARSIVDDEGHVALMSCQHAMMMGKFAGYNAISDLSDMELRPYRQPDYVTCLDLGRFGALFTKGWGRDIDSYGPETKALKNKINTQWIYPPQGTREEILAAAELDKKPGR